MAFDIDRAAVLKQIFQRTRILFVSAVIGHDGFAEFLADEHQFRFFIPLRLHLPHLSCASNGYSRQHDREQRPQIHETLF